MQYTNLQNNEGQEYTHGGDIRFMVENLEDYHFIRPPNPDPNAHQFDIES
jgi:hypothetical protein